MSKNCDSDVVCITPQTAQLYEYALVDFFFCHARILAVETFLPGGELVGDRKSRVAGAAVRT